MAYPYPYPGPIAPYNNVPIEPQWYMPRRFVISAISFGKNTTVTTTNNMDYVIGQEVRLLIPQQYGSVQLNEKTGFVISIPSATQVVVTIDSSRNVDTFVSSSYPTKPQIIAIGDVNSGTSNSFGKVNQATYIPGSFRNISPSPMS